MTPQEATEKRYRQRIVAADANEALRLLFCRRGVTSMPAEQRNGVPRPERVQPQLPRSHAEVAHLKRAPRGEQQQHSAGLELPHEVVKEVSLRVQNAYQKEFAPSPRTLCGSLA